MSQNEKSFALKQWTAKGYSPSILFHQQHNDNHRHPNPRTSTTIFLRLRRSPPPCISTTTITTIITIIINKFLPLRPARIRRSALSPWFDMECRTLRRQARRLERLYRRKRLPVDRSTWVHFVRDMHRRYRDKERSYWEAKITSNAKDSKRLWATFDAILGRRRADPQCDAPSFSA